MKALEKGLNVVLAVAVIAVAAVFANQQLRGNRPAGEERPGLVFEPKWRELPGQSKGDSLAPIQLLEVADFECPYCKAFNEVATGLEVKYGDSLRRIFVHLPIPGHRFAYAAARAAECAGEQGEFWPMHDQLFAGQDSFGIKPWAAYGEQAKLKDLKAFTLCIARTDKVSRIERGLETKSIFSIRGTPTVMVNGYRYAIPPSGELLSEAFDRILAGKVPTVGGKAPTIPK